MTTRAHHHATGGARLSPIAQQALDNARHSAKRKPWTTAEDEQLRRLYPNAPMPDLLRTLGKTVSAIYQRARTLGLARSAEYLASEHACRLRRGDNIGAAHRFQKGHATWNAGLKGWQAEGCQATQFKPGRKPHTWNPIGHERITKDGYLQRKVTDTGCTPKDYRMVHHLLWQEHHGPVPPGHAVVFRDGDKTRIEINNLELITRAELMRRNTIHRYPPELKEVIRLQKKLERTIRKQSDEKQDD
jgi:hypothetical protein